MKLDHIYQQPCGGLREIPDDSGTTAVVAVEQGLHFVGYELSEKYIKHAMNRIRRARTERQMFEGMQPTAKVKSTSKKTTVDIYEPTDDSDL